MTTTILVPPLRSQRDGSPPRAVGISANPSLGSRSRLLVERTLVHLRAAGLATDLLDLSLLSADALLARGQDPGVEAALIRVAAADVIVLGTPVYRGSYAGQLKLFFDLLPQESLRDCAVGAIATGGSPGHMLVLDHALRPLVSSLRGLTAARGVYVTDGQMPSRDVVPSDIDQQLRALGAELCALASALVR